MNDKQQLGTLIVDGRDASFRVWVDALAVDTSYPAHLALVSCAGPQTTVKSLAALLNERSLRVELKPEVEGMDGYRYRGLERSDDGYRCYRHRLDFDTFHLVAVAKTEGLLPALSTEALWQELTSPRYTTPVLRGWIGWLEEKLKAAEYLKPLGCFGCESGLLQMSGDDLDEVVEFGIREGQLKVA